MRLQMSLLSWRFPSKGVNLTPLGSRYKVTDSLLESIWPRLRWPASLLFGPDSFSMTFPPFTYISLVRAITPAYSRLLISSRLFLKFKYFRWIIINNLAFMSYSPCLSHFKIKRRINYRRARFHLDN